MKILEAPYRGSSIDFCAFKLHEPIIPQLYGATGYKLVFDSRFFSLKLSSGEHTASYPVCTQNLLPRNKERKM
jgi:hypothetical protein